ncbi:hypothetical protein CAF53_07920 [Sphingobium sp. LB126]|nr:hypothetical protein CAF53_07920 [Sphingobium sp. LB126]
MGFLKGELSTSCEFEDRRFPLSNLSVLRTQFGQVVEREAGVDREGRLIGIGHVQAGEAGRCQTVAGSFSLLAGLFQPIAQCHEFVDLGDDAVLLWERREWNKERLNAQSVLV